MTKGLQKRLTHKNKRPNKNRKKAQNKGARKRGKNTATPSINHIKLQSTALQRKHLTSKLQATTQH